VTERQAKRQIEDLAEEVLGVKDVTNHIKVKSASERQDDTSKLSSSTSTTGTTGTTRPRAST